MTDSPAPAGPDVLLTAVDALEKFFANGSQVNPPPAVYRVAEVAALLRMGRRQTYEAITRGEIPCRKIGKQVRCSKVAIHAWLDGGEPNGTTEREVGLSEKQDWTQE